MDRLVGKGRGISVPLRSSKFGTTVLIPAERQATSIIRLSDMERQRSGSRKIRNDRSSSAKDLELLCHVIAHSGMTAVFEPRAL